VTASDVDNTQIWDAKTRAAIAKLEGHTDIVESAAWSPDGTRIVTASDDKTARIWEAWPLLTADTVTYSSVTAVRGLTAEERALVFREVPNRGLPAQTTAAAPVQDVTGMSVEQLRSGRSAEWIARKTSVAQLSAAAAARNAYAHRRLAELYERGEGVEASLERALFHHLVEAQLFEEGGNEEEAQIARARRGSDARALTPATAVRVAYEAMGWQPDPAR
jgi:hypothetical protein